MKKKFTFEELVTKNKQEILDSEQSLRRIEEKIEKRHAAEQ
ncbi:MAG: FbpB family small basic protein [Sporolactobacillus sp.]